MSKSDQLQTIATTLLKNHHNDVRKALGKFVQSITKDDLIEELARQYLQNVLVSELARAKRDPEPKAVVPAPVSTPKLSPSGQKLNETQSALASPSLRGHEANETQKGVAPSKQPIPGQKAPETQAISAGHKPTVDVREHQRRQRRSALEVEAARKSAIAAANAIFEWKIEGRAIGNIRLGEALSMHGDLTDKASQNLLRGINQAVGAVVLEKIVNHCVPSDTLSRVRDVIDAKTLQRFRDEAQIEAPRRLDIAVVETQRILSNKGGEERQLPSR